MTSEEAIDILKTHYHKNPRTTYGFKVKQATEMAVEALQKRKTGKWNFGETQGHSWMKCSECCVSQTGQTLTFTYCPNCGVKMEADE